MNIIKTATLLSLSFSTSASAVTLFGGTGIDAAALQGSVDAFKSALGNGSTAANAPAGVNNADGFRGINWDAAVAPTSLPGEFFNTDFSPRARGMSLSTPGTGLAISATVASGDALRFGDLNASYTSEFTTFSPDRLFSPLGSNVIDVSFFNPANPSQAALVDGFGAVFTDVDEANLSSIQFYDANNVLLDTVFADPLNQGLSFAGIHYESEGEILSRVRINLGNAILGANDGVGSDVVVLDDFFAGEMRPVPEPSSALLLGLASLGLLRRKRS